MVSVFTLVGERHRQPVLAAAKHSLSLVRDERDHKRLLAEHSLANSNKTAFQPVLHNLMLLLRVNVSEKLRKT